MGTIITVSTAAGLMNALSHATAGQTIQLAQGDYGKLSLNPYSGFSINFPPGLTITSADPLHPASFSGLDLRGVSNLTLDSVVCDYTFAPGDQENGTPFSVMGGSNIGVTNCTFEGDVAKGVSAISDGYGYGTGLSIREVNNVTVTGNDMSNFMVAMTIRNSNNVEVAGNDIYNIRKDGMEFAQLHSATIENNNIHDFRGSPLSGDHCDFIQFWTSNTTEPSTDINITNNVLDIGNGSATHSIFMRNELVDGGLAGTSMFYKNISITQNVITNASIQGITVGEANGVTISNNTLLHADGDTPDGADDAVEIPLVNLATKSTGVTLTNNIIPGLTGYTNQPSWVINHNAFVQDQTPGAPGYYGDVFISSSLTAHDGVHQFLALPGGMIDVLGAGAAATSDFLPEPGSVAALFQSIEDHAGSMQTRTFDASLSLTSLGTLPPGTTYQWTFGDGTTATGQKVVHTFDDGGHYNVSLTVTLPSGATDTTVGTIGIQDSTIVSLGSDGYLRANDYEDTIVLPGGPYNGVTGIQLGAPGVTAVIARTHVADLLLEKDFDIALKLHADSKTSYGEVFRLYGSITTQVTSKGELLVQTLSSDGTLVQLTSNGILMNDLKSHAIDIRLHNGILQLWVDGHVASQSAFNGTMASSGVLDMTFGNQWGQKNFYGDLSGFNIRAGEMAVGQGKHILSLGDDGHFYIPDGQGGAQSLAAPHASNVAADAATSADLHLGDAGRVASVATAMVSDLLHTQSFNIAMDINADTATSFGTIFRMDGSIAARVTATGELLVRAFDDAGQLHMLSTTGGHMTDLAKHAVDIRLNDGQLQLWVDGTLANQTDFAGTLQATTGNGLNFGNLVPSGNFDGHLTGFDITVLDNNAPDSTQVGFHGASDWTTNVA